MTTAHRPSRHKPRWAAGPLRAWLLALVLGAVLAAGCAPPDDTRDAAPGTPASPFVGANRVLAYTVGVLPIQGTYTETTPWATIDHAIDRTAWSQGAGFLFHLLTLDATAQQITAQNDADNDWYADLYSRFDWTYSAGTLYYCQAVYDAASEADAAAGAASDPADLETGCGGFAWSELGTPAWLPFFQHEAVVGAPGGVFDVVSLGYDPAAADALGGTVVLGLGRADEAADRVCATDGPGADLMVYENPFPIAGGTGVNTEAVVVEVAEAADGPWYDFAPAVAPDCADLADPACYSGLAGVTPTSEGGDAFDLADAVDGAGLPAPAGFRACYVRLTDGGTRYGDYGNTQSDLYASGADVDAVEALHYEAAPGLVP